MSQFDKRDRQSPPGSSTGPERPLTHRDLVIIPEFHERSSYEFAVSFFKDVREMDVDKKVHFFGERYFNDDSKEMSAKEGIALTGVNCRESARVNLPVSFAFACVRFCHVASALGKNPYPGSQELLNETHEAASYYFAGLGRNMPANPVLAMQEFLLAEIKHAAFYASSFIKVDTQRLAQGLNAMPQTRSGNMPAELKRVIAETLGHIGEGELKAFNTLSKEAASSFGISYGGIKRERLDEIKRTIHKPDLPRAFNNLRELLGAVRDGREMVMAYFITQSAFDTAIFNCGYNHAHSELFLSLVKSKGIEVTIIDPS